MDVALFERAFSLPFQVIADDEAQTIYSLTSARVYKSEPSEAQIADSAGALADYEKLSTTLVSTNAPRYAVTFAQIDDDDPTSSNDYETYYVVFSVVLESGGTVVNRWKPFIIWRGTPTVSAIDITTVELFNYDDELENLLTTARATAKIDMAKRRVLRQIRSRGFSRDRIKEYDANDAVLALSAFYCWRALNHTDKATSYYDEYKEIFETYPIGADGDGDKVIKPGDDMKTANVFFSR